MPSDPSTHTISFVDDQLMPNHRRSIRLRDYDYSQSGAYFVTICAQDRAMLFGEVVNDVMVLSPFGHVVQDCWLGLTQHFENIELDAFVIMPNHMHGILVILAEDASSVGGEAFAAKAHVIFRLDGKCFAPMHSTG